MNTIFNDPERDGLIKRISALALSDRPDWGKMSVSQMVEHNIRWEEMMAGKRRVGRVFLGYLFGKMALKSMISDDRPVRRNMPTMKELRVADKAPITQSPKVDLESFESQKEKWIDLVKAYQHNTAQSFMHPFFGRMTKEQTGVMVYKHTDHHLRQFGR